MCTTFTHFTPLVYTDLGIASSDARSFAEFLEGRRGLSLTLEDSSRSRLFRPYSPRPAALTRNTPATQISTAPLHLRLGELTEALSTVRMPSPSDFIRASPTYTAAPTPQPLRSNISNPLGVTPLLESSDCFSHTPHNQKCLGSATPSATLASVARTDGNDLDPDIGDKTEEFERKVTWRVEASHALVKIRHGMPEHGAGRESTLAHHVRSVSTSDVPVLQETAVPQVQVAARPSSVALDTWICDEENLPVTSCQAGPTDLPALPPQRSTSSLRRRRIRSPSKVSMHATTFHRRAPPTLQPRPKQTQSRYCA